MTTAANFHEGEVRLQAESRVDTSTFDAMVGEGFQPRLQANEVRFVNQRTFAVAASVDSDGRPWASPLVRATGELFEVQDPKTVRIMPPRVHGDPLFDNVGDTGELGVLYFDPSHRRRAKSLGHGSIGPDGSIDYRMRRNYGLCTKYIFKRSHEAGERGDSTSTPGRQAPRLDHRLADADQVQLHAADTVFLASHHVDHGADATHRGGPAGFVTVIDDTHITMPDYLGNGMFQTLGNLILDERVGLLSINFATGRTIQVTGRGSIRASGPEDPYSERMLDITVDEVSTTWPDVGRWTDIEAFELRPGLRNPATPYLA